MKLYSYFRSSAAYRVRIALNLKNITYDIIPIHLVKAEHKTDDYANKNPAKLLPSLELDNGKIITQSMAILDYLENEYPNTPLLPKDNYDRAIINSMCNIIACDTHPVNNLRVLQYLTNELKISDEQKQNWYAHWITVNFQGLEKLLEIHSGTYCFGDSVTMADICLVPQVYNANRFKVDLSAFPNVVRISDNCNKLDAFIKASPEKQVDFE